MEMMAMETVKAISHEYRIADKQRPVEPRVPPVVRLGVGIQVHGLWRQRVDLLRQSRRIQRDLPTSIWLQARLSNGLSRLPFNRDLRGELAAVLKGRPYWRECRVRQARGNLPGTARQDQQHRDTQKGVRTSTSRRRELSCATSNPRRRCGVILDAYCSGVNGDDLAQSEPIRTRACQCSELGPYRLPARRIHYTPICLPPVTALPMQAT
jgi:hypothetical protein